MTVIAVTYDPETRTGAMAADRQDTHNDRKFTLAEPKIYEIGCGLLGFCGSEPAIQVMKETMLTQLEGVDLESNALAAVSATFQPMLEALVELRELFVHGDDPDEWMGAGGVLLSPAGIIVIDSCLTIFPSADTIYADGSGGDIALGYMSAFGHEEIEHTELVEGAVEAAIRWDPYCGGPIDVFAVE